MSNKSEVKISLQIPIAVNEAYKKIAKKQGTSKNAVMANVLIGNLLKQEKNDSVSSLLG